MQAKEKVRSSLKQQAKQFVSASFTLEDKASVLALLESPAYTSCTTLFAFYPLQSEVDITVVLEDAIKAKSLALPRCIGDALEFVFVSEDWDMGMKESTLGVLEPLGSNVAIPDKHSLILVPALAYTALGLRLGRGKGYYDRYLSHYSTIPTIGICRSYQLLDSIPTEKWDMRVREVLCNGVFY